MESRMEKYYSEDLSSFERSRKNKELYREVSNQISDLDNLPVPDNSNEIDIAGLKQIISSRDEYRKVKELENTFISEKPISFEDKKEKEDRIYDINVLLANAKSDIQKEKVDTEKLKVASNFLTKMDESDIPYSDDAIDIATETLPIDNKKDSNTDSLPLDILVDLKGSENTIVTDPIVKEEVTMIKKDKDSETFYSGSYTFSKKDFFSEEEDDSFIEKKSHTGLKVFFLIFGILILGVIIYFLLTKYVL